MALDTLQYFFQRVPCLNYVSPPICEVEFSSSAFPTIILNPNSRRLGPTGLEFFASGGRIFLRWNNYPGAICFSIYKAVDELDPFGDFSLVAECVQSPFEITDPGIYRVSAITLEGETLFSDVVTITAPPPPGPEACIETPGPLAPFGLTPFEIEAEVEWSVEEIRIADFYDDPAFPGGYSGFPGQFMFRDLPEDYPPGNYTLRYVSGFFDLGETGAPCGAGQHRYTNAPSGRLLVDDEWNGFVVGTGLADTILWQDFQCADPSFAGPAQANMSANLAGTQAFVWNPHSNTGGGLRLVSGPGATPPYPAPGNDGDDSAFTPMLQLVQLDGLIQQPRGVRIASWAAVQGGFPGEVSSNWDGQLPERTTYTQTELVHTAAPNGAFGGATLRFITDHPTSAAGTGWEIEVFVGATLVWRGLKQYDETGEGVYFRATDSPTLTPLCLEIEQIP